MKRINLRRISGAFKALVLGLPALLIAQQASAQTCPAGGREVLAQVVALDQPVMFNRLGASNVNGMIYSLRRDVVQKGGLFTCTKKNGGTYDSIDGSCGTFSFSLSDSMCRSDIDGRQDYTADADELSSGSCGAPTKSATGIGSPLHPEASGGVLSAGNVALRPDKRPRPLVLRVREGDCLTVQFTNLLAPVRNPVHLNDLPLDIPPRFNVFIDDQVAERRASIHFNGVEYLDGPGASDGAFVGENADSTAAVGQTRTYTLYAPKDGAYMVRGMASTLGSDANQGNASNLLLGQLIVEPKNSAIYRSQVANEELDLATVGTTASGHPQLDYNATYPVAYPWDKEGKAGLPVLNMMACGADGCEIVHNEINAFVAYGPSGQIAQSPTYEKIVAGPDKKADTEVSDDQQGVAKGTGGHTYSVKVVTTGPNGSLTTIPAGDDGVADDVQRAAVGSYSGSASTLVVSAGADGKLSTRPAGDDLLADDVQVLAVGAKGANPNAIAVSAGPDGRLSTVPAGDDKYDGSGNIAVGKNKTADTVAARNVITAGANGIADTAAEKGWIHAGANGIAETDADWSDDVQLVAVGELVADEGTAVVAPGPDGVLQTAPKAGDVKKDTNPHSGMWGHFPPDTYPLERYGKRNPTVPNRLTPFRDYASVWHDEPATAQAFPLWYDDRTQPTNGQFRFVLAGVKDGFMINYGSGGIGSEIIANRLGVGPMHDCLSCAYEEFFLTSYTVGDPAQLVDIPANAGLEQCNPSLQNCAANGPKATRPLYTEDPANIHHSYTGDHAKFRNTHVGKEQHVFHLHNHQWLYNPNDDNSNYLDAQGIGPGAGYTYEINFGGSGNRNKSSGDAIFHCHFYPHFAQGMWYHWRIHDVFEAGTELQVTLDGGGVHPAWMDDVNRLGLGDGTPAPGARALPDGELLTGVPIPAIVPLPGKGMAPVPGEVTVKLSADQVCVGDAFTFGKAAPNADGTCPAGMTLRPTGSQADSSPLRDASGALLAGAKNPGYPFWVAGIEEIVGQRPPTPPLDMLNPGLASKLFNGEQSAYHYQACVIDGVTYGPERCENPQDLGLWRNIDVAQADGWDGGLPRGSLKGIAAGGTRLTAQNRLDFSVVLTATDIQYYPEEGTDLEHLAMAYHAIRHHPSCRPDGTCDQSLGGTGGGLIAFETNGAPPSVGAAYHEPCIDDRGIRVEDTMGSKYSFFSGETIDGMSTRGSSVFNANSPRIYKGTNLQYDAVLNKAGYHYPQQRIIALWQDAVPVIMKEQAGQPLVMRLNTFDCAVYHHSNLVPEIYEVDDYQVRTPTDIIGQHIHLPKWDLTTTDGAANGWNYEDGTLSPGAVHERIEAIRHFNHCAPEEHNETTCPEALPHPYFGQVAPAELAEEWLGARTTIQRWFADPVVNTEGEDRGLGIIFTHDHYGPSTHQQIGLYATVLAEPAGAEWKHNESGMQLGCNNPDERPTELGATSQATDPTTGLTVGCRNDGGPTAWQAAIIPPTAATSGSSVRSETLDAYREFYFEYSDFQHAYEAGVYVGADQMGKPIGHPLPGAADPVFSLNTGNPDWDGTDANAFRFAINPPARDQVSPVFPELVIELENTLNQEVNFCPVRPCPQAIDVEDPGMFAVNYRNEPIGLRIYDPHKIGPDGLPGTQADGYAGDLAWALAGKDDLGNDIVRKFEVKKNNTSFGSNGTAFETPTGYQVMNFQPKAGDMIHGTVFPPPINTEFNALKGSDPFTPLLRGYGGDLFRVKMQAGGHEEEHNATLLGLRWLQAGSGHGRAGNSGWRAAQAGGISEQFTLSFPVIGVVGETGNSTDHAYSMDASQDGWFSGMWGIIRVYNGNTNNLYKLPARGTDSFGSLENAVIANNDEFQGACPAVGSGNGNGANGNNKTPLSLRTYDVTAVLANDVLPNPGFDVSADPCAGDIANCPAGNRGHEGNWPLAADGGSLVYNPGFSANGLTQTEIHDPTAVLYVHTTDLQPKAGSGNCITVDAAGNEIFSPELATCQVEMKPAAPIEPLILRVASGECLEVTLRNALPPLLADGTSQMPDRATYSEFIGAVKRDRFAVRGLETGSTTFQPNLTRASGWAGIHAQLLETDNSRDNGILVGMNSNTNSKTLIQSGQTKVYTWYAGHIDASKGIVKNKPAFTLSATPVEYGAANLTPADVLKQGQKSMVGQIVVEPEGSTWSEDGIFAASDGSVSFGADATRAQATVSAQGGDFRDFSSVWTKGLTHYYRDNTAVEHINGEGVGIPEDSQESTGMAINYRIEPLWFRAGILPNADFGTVGDGTGFGDLTQFDIFSNGKVGRDPVTPIFRATAGQPFRLRVANPYGTSRGTTFQLHGHVWQRDPYVCAGSKDGMPGRCSPHETGSTRIGNNIQAFYQGGQESITPATHFDIVLPSAGGVNAAAGDYMYRDAGSLGNASGLWGILRVQAAE